MPALQIKKMMYYNGLDDSKPAPDARAVSTQPRTSANDSGASPMISRGFCVRGRLQCPRVPPVLPPAHRASSRPPRGRVERSRCEAAGIPASSVGGRGAGGRRQRARRSRSTPATAMNPASVMKLVTTYAALELLGPAYRWKTEAYRPAADGVLRRPGPQGLRRPEAQLRELLDAAARAARRGAARDPRRPGARPQLLRRRWRDRGASTTSSSARTTSRPTRCSCNFKSLRFVFMPAGDRRARVRRAASAGLEVVNGLRLADGRLPRRARLPRPDRRPSVRRFAAAARRLHAASTRSSCGEKELNVALYSPRGLRRRHDPPALGGDGRHLDRQGARRRRAAGGAAHPRARVAAARRDRARHQQVLQQRDGAPALPHARRAISAARRRSAESALRARAPVADAQERARARARDRERLGPLARWSASARPRSRRCCRRPGGAR